jgi:hypothetical protein
MPEHLISKTANTPSASRLDHHVLDPVPLDGGEAPLSQRETADSERLGARRGGPLAELNKAEHEAKQAERHKQLSIEREAKKQARREAHRLQQEERDRLAKERSLEKLKKAEEDFHREKKKRDAELRREKSEREAEERRIKREEQEARNRSMMMSLRRRYLGEDDDE